jgi:hypothetical protein
MNINNIREVQRPASADEIGTWQDGNAWLAGGTWLYSEPQIAVDTLIDLELLGWPALESSADGLTIAATCRIAELYRFCRHRNGPPRRCSTNAAIRSSHRSRFETLRPSAVTSACRCRRDHWSR